MKAVLSRDGAECPPIFGNMAMWLVGYSGYTIPKVNADKELIKALEDTYTDFWLGGRHIDAYWRDRNPGRHQLFCLTG
ncbi:MAG: hypothetical protein FWG10_06085 [Eubacteriaceae bacterium]|nr:hypothetical protein [Eubacteriaceae bacterium]